MQYAIIDESGRFSDPKSRIIVFPAVVASSLIGLDKIIPQVEKKIPTRTLAEIKFATTGDKTKARVLHAISQKDIKLYLLVLDTEGRKVKDNPENYALIVSYLLSKILKANPDLKHVIIDRHFTWVHQREKFNDLVQRFLRKKLFIEHLDSQQNTVVSLADFVAGGTRTFYARGIDTWIGIIKRKIVSEEKLSWRKLRGKTKR